jgi:hypothetical protein
MSDVKTPAGGIDAEFLRNPLKNPKVEDPVAYVRFVGDGTRSGIETQQGSSSN